MADDAIMTQLTEILRDIFENPDLAVTPETTAKMVPGWDSMAQVKVLMAVEEAFGMRFSSREMGKLRDVGEMAAAIARHTGKAA